MSAWVKASSFYENNVDVDPILRKGGLNPNTYRFMLHKGNPSVGLEVRVENARYDGTLLETGKWYPLAVTWAGDKLEFYVNGKSTGSTTVMKDAGLSQDDPPLFIGGREAIEGDSSDQFHGILDEVQLSRVEPSSAWLKLAYENQRPESPLLETGVVTTNLVDSSWIELSAKDNVENPSLLVSLFGNGVGMSTSFYYTVKPLAGGTVRLFFKVETEMTWKRVSLRLQGGPDPERLVFTPVAPCTLLPRWFIPRIQASLFPEPPRN